jgi:hypothetical protein
MPQLWPLDPAAYAPHSLHRGERTWPESNCYVDLWIELLHAWGMEPIAALPFTLTIDLEGDQWTFFKFPLADLQALYGLEVFELSVWRPLPAHIENQLAQGRPVIVEVDAYWLPDTVGTCYRADHVKTSVAVQAIDVGRQRLGYFHNAGYFELDGADFAGALRTETPLGPEHLPPYVEVVKPGGAVPGAGRDLARQSVELLRMHLRRRPAQNPFRRYAKPLVEDLRWLSGESLPQFHRYAFATLRQFGAAFELAGACLRWLEGQEPQDLQPAARSCESIAGTAKALQFKIARAVQTHRAFDPTPALEAMAAEWDEIMSALTLRYGSLAHVR